MKRKFIFVFVLVVGVGFGCAVHAQSIGITLPSVPTGLSATVVPPSQISLSWGASTESSGTIVDYDIYRNGMHITTTAGRSFTDSGLAPGYYSYAVAAVDANNNVSAQSLQANATLISDTTSPTVPVNVTVKGTTSTNAYYKTVTLTISWTVSTDNVGVIGYYVRRNGAQIVSSTTPFSGTSVTDAVTPGSYTYTVTAYDAAQNVSNQSTPVTVTVGVDGIPPSVPSNISAVQTSPTGVTVTWATSTDPAAGSGWVSGIGGYQVFRNGNQIASAGGPPYADSGMPIGFIYNYTVGAYDVAGNVSAQSAASQVMVQQENGPSAPSSLAASLFGTSTVKLSWSPAVDVVAITKYTIYRNGIPATSTTSTGYLDIGLASGTYLYNVNAVDVNKAVSATSSPASVVVPAFSSVILPPIITPPTVVSSTATTTKGGQAFTQFLYFGLRGDQVQALQSLLVGQGYLMPANATGFFGSLTLRALQKLQCDKNIVCTGGAGWGMVGPKTRNSLNSFVKSSVVPSTFPTSSFNGEVQVMGH